MTTIQNQTLVRTADETPSEQDLLNQIEIDADAARDAASDADAYRVGGALSGDAGDIDPEDSAQGLAAATLADRLGAEAARDLAIAGIRRDWQDVAQLAAYRAAASAAQLVNVDKVFGTVVGVAVIANPAAIPAIYIDRVDRAFMAGGVPRWRAYANDASGTAVASISSTVSLEAEPFILLTGDSGLVLMLVINWGSLAVGEGPQTYGAGILLSEEVMRGRQLPQQISGRLDVVEETLANLGGGGGEAGPPLVSVGYYTRPTPTLFAATLPSGVPPVLNAPPAYPAAPLHGWAWATASERVLTGTTLTNDTGTTVLVRRRCPGVDGLYYMGGWDASGPYPVPDAVGQQVANKFWGRMYWVVTTAGNGFAVGDRLVCRGLATGTNTIIVLADADAYYYWDRVPAGLNSRGVGRKLFLRGAFNPTTDALATVGAGLADGDYLEVTATGTVDLVGYGTVPVAAGDRLIRAGGRWEAETSSPVRTLASGASLDVGDAEGGIEIRRADGSPACVFVQMGATSRTSLTAYTEAVGEATLLRIVDEADGVVDTVPELVAAFPGASVLALAVAPDASHIDLRLATEAGAVEARYLPATRRLRVRSNKLAIAGDSIAAHLHNGAEDEMPEREPEDLGLASANAASISEGWRYWAQHAEDTDIGGRILLAVLDYAVAGKSADAGIYEAAHFEALAQFDRALVLAHLNTREVAWTGSAIAVSGGPTAADHRLVRMMTQLYGRRYVDVIEVALAAVAGVYDPQVPGAADQVAAVAAAGGRIMPFGWYKATDATKAGLLTFAAVESYRGQHQGYWTTAGLPSGGVDGDHYIVATAGSGNAASEVGDLLLRTGGAWVWVGLDDIHPGTSMQTALAQAVDARLTELGW